MSNEIMEQRFTPEETEDIREIALLLRKYKHTHTIQQITIWAIDEFLRRRYVRDWNAGKYPGNPYYKYVRSQAMEVE